MAISKVVQDSLNGGVAGTGPAFGAYDTSGTSCSSGVWTKINFPTEDFDTNSNFASSRFTPTVAGYYQLSTDVTWGGGAWSADTVAIGVYKNGSSHKLLNRNPRSTNYMWQSGSVLVYANGSSDYFEIYAVQNSGSSRSTDTGSDYTWFTGVLVKAA